MNNELISALIEYGYVIMFFMMIIEGPIVTLAAAFLASLGHFSLGWVFALSVVGDLAGDVLWYGIGRQWGRTFILRYGRYIGVSEDLIHKVQKTFHRHGSRAVLAAKSTTGLCLATFIVAGMVHMPLKKFLGAAFLGGIFWTTFLVCVGYFFGAAFEKIAQYISWAGWLIGGVACATIVMIGVYRKKNAHRMLEKNMLNN